MSDYSMDQSEGQTRQSGCLLGIVLSLIAPVAPDGQDAPGYCVGYETEPGTGRPDGIDAHPGGQKGRYDANGLDELSPRVACVGQDDPEEIGDRGRGPGMRPVAQGDAARKAKRSAVCTPRCA